MTRYEDLESLLTRDYARRQLRSADTLAQVRLPHLRRHFGGLPVARIDARAISAYVDSRLAQRAAPASVNRELAALSAMLRLGRELRLLTEEQPVKIRMLPEHNVREGFVENAQFARIVDSLQADELRDLARFLYITGWRRREAQSLLWSDIHGLDPSLWSDIHGLDPSLTANSPSPFMERGPGGVVSDSEIRLRSEMSKTGKPRILPIRGPLADIVGRALSRRHPNCAYVFHRRGFPIRDFRRAWKSACTAAGCVGVIPHDLRRSAIRNLIRRGVPETVAMAISGHRTRKTFDRYNITSAADLARAMEGFSACGHALHLRQ